jgi:hypothetical protein
MSRQIKGNHKEDDNDKEELKFTNIINDDTFPYRIKNISVDGRIIIIIIKNGLQTGWRGVDWLVTGTRGGNNLLVTDNTGKFLNS